MTIVAAAAVLVALVAGVALFRMWRRAQDLEEELFTAVNERDVLASETVAARGQANAARRERDEAIERLERGAAAEADARTAQAAAEGATATATAAEARVAELEEELDAARRAPAAVEPSPPADTSFEVMWALALARVESMWKTSISLGLDESPLADSGDPFRTAVGVMIDAAREEAGADIELRWSGEVPAPPAAAVVALAVIESAIASVAKSAWSTEVHVAVSDAEVEVRFESLDDAGDFFQVEVPSALSDAPNHIRVPVPGRAPVLEN